MRPITDRDYRHATDHATLARSLVGSVLHQHWSPADGRHGMIAGTSHTSRSTLASARAALVGSVVVATAVSAIQGLQRGYDGNFQIFRSASDHLRGGLDLYAPYPALTQDLYKYSPTFALLFTPWASLPFALAHLAWMLFCALSLWYALTALYPDRRGAIAWLIVSGSLVLDLQRSQTNALVAATMIGAFVASDRHQSGRAALLIGLGTAVKLFPAIAVIGIVWQPSRRRAVMVGVLVALLLVVLPLLVTTPELLWRQYASWLAIERLDAQSGAAQCVGCVDRDASGAALYGGIMYQLRLLFGPMPNLPVQLLGLAAVVVCVLARRAAWNDGRFRRLVLAALLLYAVVFNHQAESPSFVIAVCGMAIWYLERGSGRWQLPLLVVAAGIATFGAGDLVPRALRMAVMLPYRVRTVPCFLMWIVVLSELLHFPVPRRVQPAESDESNVVVR